MSIESSIIPARVRIPRFEEAVDAGIVDRDEVAFYQRNVSDYNRDQAFAADSVSVLKGIGPRSKDRLRRKGIKKVRQLAFAREALLAELPSPLNKVAASLKAALLATIPS